MKLPTTSPATWVKDMKENLVFSSENHWHSGQSHKKIIVRSEKSEAINLSKENV